ncbi:F-BAR and double SH3 domains protein 2 isoform X3 [Spodoptera litura]|uniref:F-BAR and double SH3 domains protein 2 isoform X3 n=1 Tax=Spodoptera litura TaxID=69820 RepID=A0A9J7IZC4_SPOLT|nr:F-BAR and double SH3 domains protein 2 isoform X3 [Spodoptera litura]
MQPPPRKSNYTKFLKNLHTEQIAKLHAKNQHECDLLEDLRTYTIKRSAIEKSYSEALLKISSAYLNKKIPNIPDIKVDGAEEKWNMWNVWRTVLEENEKLARARLAAVEVFQQQIADEAKFLRQHKLNVAKKCTDTLAQAHKELQTTVIDVDKTKKLYFDEEHTAHDVRDKAKDIEEKLKKKKGSFFQSITSLQKNSAKVSSRRDQLEEKSTGARNDYLLSIAAANAHQNRYFLVELQNCMLSMEAAVYEKVSEFLTFMGRTELLTCSATQHSFGKIRDQAQQLTRDYNLQCLYLYYPVLKQHIQYEFEPCDNDPIDSVTIEHESVAQTLGQEARRWATRVLRETSLVRDATRKMNVYQAMRDAGQKVDPNDPNGPELDVRLDELRATIRRSEISKAKYESRLECLRVSGAPVDDWLKEVDLLAVQEPLQRSSSLLSVRTDASGAADQPSSDSFYDSDNTEGEGTSASASASASAAVASSSHQRTTSGSQNDDEHDEDVDAMLEEDRMRIEQLAVGWDDPTQVNWDEGEPAAETVEAPAAPLYKCTALYSYTAQNPDELSIIESEQLEVVGEGDGDGWLRARNYRGEEGYVPHNYLDVDREQPCTSSGAPGLVSQISFSSVDYTVEGEDADVVQSPDQISVISAPAAKAEEPKAEEQAQQESFVAEWPTAETSKASAPASAAPKPDQPTLGYCFAMYDYDAECPEELNLEEGQIIRILSREAHGVDDGWWRGEANGVVGNFPSLIVEECDENGEPLSGGEEWPPLTTAPPVFASPPHTPPEAAGAQDQVEIDNNNTKGAAPPDAPPPPPPPDLGDSMDSQPDFSFNLELSRNQQEHYGTQFAAPSVTIVVDEVVGECWEENIPEPVQAVQTEQTAEDCGLGVAQIVITAATPMVEEPDQPFPPPEPEAETEPNGEAEINSETLPEPEREENDDDESSLSEQTAVCLRDSDDGPADSAPHPHSSSTASEGESGGASVASGPPTAPQSPPAAPRGGRASIPDELEPAQLARLTDLKESNA